MRCKVSRDWEGTGNAMGKEVRLKKLSLALVLICGLMVTLLFVPTILGEYARILLFTILPVSYTHLRAHETKTRISVFGLWV